MLRLPGQRIDLKPAGIGEHGVRPVHESMNAAELLEQGDARPQQQVISVCQNDLHAAVEQILSPLRPY